MRLAGRIHDWNDEKGYGFVMPSGGGERFFVHIKAFQHGSRRPVDGDLVSYAVVRDARGRASASEVRFAGQRIEATGAQTAQSVPRSAIGSCALGGILACTALGALPALVAIAYVVASGLSWLLYFSDKAAAGRKGVRRTPESTLHLVDLLGGWPGALIAQQRYRHKTSKVAFQRVFWCTVAGNVALVAWAVRTGTAARLDAMLLG